MVCLMSPRLTLVVFMILMALPGLATAHSARKPCPHYFAEMAKAVDRDILTPNEIKLAESILRDPSVPRAEAVNKVFEIYVDARLRNLAEDIKEPILSLLAERIKMKKGGFMGSHYSPRNRSITIHAPAQYLDSIAELNTRAHELEHAIIDQTHRTLFGRPGAPSIWTLRWREMRYNDELAAMRAEWNMMQAVPQKIREEMMGNIAADSKISKDLRDFMMRTLRNASFDRETYIRMEHEAGRYSMGQLTESDIINKVTIAGGLVGTLGLGSIGSVLVITEYCAWKVSDKRFDRNKEWFQKICNRNALVADEILKERSTFESKQN